MPYNDSPAIPDAIAYRTRLHPWVIVRLLPTLQRIVVGRFRNRSDAEGHLQCLRSLLPQASFVVLFDPKSF